MSRDDVIVTGGAGFVGSHLVDKLLQQGHCVICLDSCMTGRKANIAKHLSNPNFEFIRHDITEPIKLEADFIYHLASPASPIHYQKNRIKTLKTNVLGTMNVLGTARRCGARVLMASTSEVYGEAQEHPQTESYFGNVNPVGPRSCYDEGKRAAEALCMDYHRQHAVEVRIARLFNTYGPRMLLDDGRVMSNFVSQAIRGEDMTIYGDGEQTRSFCYIDDMIDGLIAHMHSDHVQPINIGNPEEISIKRLAEMIRAEVNPDIGFSHVPFPLNDPKERRPDITKAKEILGWEPKIPLETGLKKLIFDFRERFAHGEGEVARFL